MVATCSFIKATEARNIARNASLIWSEISEVQTQILTAIDNNLYSVIVNSGTPMTVTGSILSATVTAGGTNYDPVVATATINANGTSGVNATLTPIVTGTTITGFTITSGGSLVLQSATVPTRGAGYSINDVLTLVGGTFTTVATTTVVALSTIAAQNQTNYDGAGSNGTFTAGDGPGGTAYVVNDVITLDDGSTITVDSIDGDGDVVNFTVTTATTIGITGELAIVSQSGAVVGAGNGVNFALTQGTANQGAFTVATAVAGVYTVAPGNPVVTVVGSGPGSGATLNAIIIAGYAPVSVTATVNTPRDLITGQDETNFDGSSPNGSFTAGDDYRIGEVISLADGSTATVSASGISAIGVVSIAAQDETNFDGVGANGSFVGGDGAGGTAYIINDIITLSDGSGITVDAIDVNGDVTQFTVTTASTVSYTSGGLLLQVGSVAGLGNGIGFTITSDTNNEITVGSVILFDTLSPGVTPFFQTILLQTSTDGIGTGFTLTPLGNNTITPLSGTGVTLVVAETNGSITSVTALGGSGYIVGATISFAHPVGVNAIASVSAVDGNGVITAITVSNSGTGFQQVTATVSVLPPDPAQTPALAFVGTVITTNGSVTGISIQVAGSGYAELLPTVLVTDPSGAGAILTTVVVGGAVTAINVVNGGFDYSATPTLTIDAAVGSSGTGATATAAVDINTFGTIASAFNDVLTGQTTNAVILDQITFVLDYFISLGYNIRGQTNPTTANTLQWQIIW